VLFDSLDWQLCILAVLLGVIHDGSGGRGKVDVLEQGCWPGSGGSVFFFRLRWWDAVDFAPRWYGDVPGQHVTTTCALLLATGMFIYLQSLVSDGASMNLEMVKARRLFQYASRRCWSLAVAAGFGKYRKL
jgi:hypothetical protein